MTSEELLITKMCHDMAGVIGTLDNLVDLLKMDTTFIDDGADLLKQSTSTLVARLKFFRLWLGSTGEITPKVGIDYLKTLSAPFDLTGNLSDKVDLALLAFAIDVLPQGGQICIQNHGLSCQGRQIKCDMTKITLPQPQNASYLWIADFAKNNEKSINLTINDTSLQLNFQ